MAALLTGVRAAAGATGWAPLAALQEWITVGRLGPGTLMEAPGIATGVALEPEWAGMSPWPTLLFWLAVAVSAILVGLRRADPADGRDAPRRRAPGG